MYHFLPALGRVVNLGGFADRLVGPSTSTIDRAGKWPEEKQEC